MQPYEKASKLSRKDIIFNNFLGGIAWAFGATIGLSLIIALLTLISPYLNLIPLIGTFISYIVDFVVKHPAGH